MIYVCPIKSNCGDTIVFHTYSCTVRVISAASNVISPTFNLNGIDLLCAVKYLAPEVLEQ